MVFSATWQKCVTGYLFRSFLLLALVLSAGIVVSKPAEARKYAAFVMEADTGRVLFSRYADELRYPASLTKMMTLYMAFESIEQGRLSWNTKLRISKRAAGQPPSKLGLRKGQTIRVKDAVMALITKSANDAATVLAEAMGKTEWEFAQLMTRKAKQLGMRKTSFRNASGLPNRRQRTTARDMAKLGLALQRDFPQHYKLFDTTKFTYKGRTYRNHNRLLSSLNGTNGIKTGYIRASGFNLVSSVERNGKTLIGVVMGGKTSRSRDAHMVKIINRAFKRAGPAVRTAALPALPVPRPGSSSTQPNTIGDLVAQVTMAPNGIALPTPRPSSVESPVVAPATLVAAINSASIDVTTGNVQGIWGIQVGAFKTKTAASVQLDKVLDTLPLALQNMAQQQVELMDTQGRRLYRARMAGFDKNKAVQACGHLIARNVSCVTIPPERLRLTGAQLPG